ncbi:hypothetical protein SAMN06295888_1337 [Desulfonatronum zhilinae]|nr:hypothetical protein SAMN06295888_1337 [Desulfonatronum zhilinae]
MPEDKQYFVERFAADPLTADVEQEVALSLFAPGDETGVSRLYHAVYGDAYPVEDYYIPRRILELNREQQLSSVVCKTEDGVIVAHGALYRSSPPFAGLLEVGQYLVLKSHRRRNIAEMINTYIHGPLAESLPVEGIYAEPVTNHIVTQLFGVQAKMADYAVQLGLLPPSQGWDGASGRMSCFLQFKTVRDRPHRVHLPERHRDILDFILADRDFQRTFAEASDTLPTDGRTVHQVQVFPGTGTARFQFPLLGADFPGVLEGLESEALRAGCVTLQAFLNLGQAEVGGAVERLCAGGWFLGGYLPRWFDSDGLLMQKILERPDYAAIRLHNDKARALLERIRAEQEKTAPLQGKFVLT